jgi:hypothetical protein
MILFVKILTTFLPSNFNFSSLFSLNPTVKQITKISIYRQINHPNKSNNSTYVRFVCFEDTELCVIRMCSFLHCN